MRNSEREKKIGKGKEKRKSRIEGNVKWGKEKRKLREDERNKGRIRNQFQQTAP